MVTRPTWSWYAHEVKNVKSPRGCLRDAMRKTRGRWMRDPQLYEIVATCFGQEVRSTMRSSSTNVPSITDGLSYIGIPEGQSRLGGRLCSLSWALLGHRAWSMVARHHGPPECYADLLSSVEAYAEMASIDIKELGAAARPGAAAVDVSTRPTALGGHPLR